MITSAWANKNLIALMVKREIIFRYRGSFMGIAWSFIVPLIMLSIYTFVFSVVFKARWGIDQSESKADFAIMLFAGIIIHAFFSECINRAPDLILTNVNYVKKVVFPLDILSWVTLGTALFQTIISLLILLGAQLILDQSLPWTFILFPVVLTPLLVLTLGVCWLFASMGVFIRDIRQVTGILTTILLFMSPIFYPRSQLPESFQSLLMLNPLSFIIEQSRAVLILGNSPDWLGLLLYLAVAMLIAWACFYLFQKTRKGFADVI